MKQIRLSGWVGERLPGISDKGTTTTVHIRAFINLKARHFFVVVVCVLFFAFFVFLFISVYM